MSDTFARMRQLIGSTSEWAANDIVLGFGEIGIERVSASEYKAKVGDGTAQWSALPYLSAVASGLNATMQAALDAKLAIAGGTMKGDLILAHDGTKPNEAVTVTQLQNTETRLNTSLTGKLDKSGGTLTGGLLLSHAATQPLEAVTFDQMNKALAAISLPNAIIYAGTVDPTKAHAAPVPAPVNGNLYTASAAGALDPSWAAHIVGTPPTTIAIGDQFTWDSASGKFHYAPTISTSGAYVPLAGTGAMIGNIVWGGAAANKKGVAIISGKGGTLDEILIDEGYW